MNLIRNLGIRNWLYIRVVFLKENLFQRQSVIIVLIFYESLLLN